MLLAMKIIYDLNMEDNVVHTFWINLYFFLQVFFKGKSIHFMNGIDRESVMLPTDWNKVTLAGTLKIEDS